MLDLRGAGLGREGREIGRVRQAWKKDRNGASGARGLFGVGAGLLVPLLCCGAPMIQTPSHTFCGLVRLSLSSPLPPASTTALRIAAVVPLLVIGCHSSSTSTRGTAYNEP